jgi:hypothetical protein
MLDQVHKAFRRARARRADWEPVWRDCYEHTAPQRSAGLVPESGRKRPGETLFDGTAGDATEQLAASLLAELTPPWSQWFGLRPGHAIDPSVAGEIAERLEEASERAQGHFNRSNFSIEMHQCLLDLTTIGTATLMFKEAAPGAASAFEFHAVPAAEMFLEGDQNGRIRNQFRRTSLTLASLRRSFPKATLPDAIVEAGASEPERGFEVVEAVLGDPEGCTYTAYMPRPQGSQDGPVLLNQGRFERSPFITFRWLKAAGDLYGRSPVMTALPDIKTANRVVELVLKNATIAVTGIWLADDDGVLNPANIRLQPGSIIPKAVGSAGLTPLQAPGRFDISELVLEDLRSRIRHALLVDRLGPIKGARMTATEVLERSTETARILCAVFGRLQAELIVPLIERALGILRRRGEIAEFAIDGREAEIDFRSPLARAQAREDVTNTLLWLETVQKLGPVAAQIADLRSAALWLARTLGVPTELVRNEEPLAEALAAMRDIAGAS